MKELRALNFNLWHIEAEWNGDSNGRSFKLCSGDNWTSVPKVERFVEDKRCLSTNNQTLNILIAIDVCQYNPAIKETTV